MPTRVNRQTVDLTPYPDLVQPARGHLFGSAARVGRPEDTVAPVVTEGELYTPDAQPETR